MSKTAENPGEIHDGFYIAAQDLKLRGPGDLFGIRQSGRWNSGWRISIRTLPLLQKASEAAGEILTLDPLLELEQYGKLKEKLAKYMKYQLESLGL